MTEDNRLDFAIANYKGIFVYVTGGTNVYGAPLNTVMVFNLIDYGFNEAAPMN